MNHVIHLSHQINVMNFKVKSAYVMDSSLIAVMVVYKWKVCLTHSVQGEKEKKLLYFHLVSASYDEDALMIESENDSLILDAISSLSFESTGGGCIDLQTSFQLTRSLTRCPANGSNY